MAGCALDFGQGRTVLVVDDILDEGVTLAAVRDRLQQQGAAEVLVAVVADKENGKQEADRCGFRCAYRARPFRLRFPAWMPAVPGVICRRSTR